MRATSSGCGEPPQRDPRLVGGPLRVDVDSLRCAGLDELDRTLRQGRSGRDCVHADPVGAELERHGLRQPPDRVLRSPVMREPGATRVDGVDRGDVDDRAAVTVLPHPGRRGTNAEEGTADVHADDAVELGGRHVLEQEVREDARVVHEHVETAEGRDRRLHQALDVLLDGDVALDGDDVRPAAARRSRAASSRSSAPVGDHDRGSGFREPARAREAEALRRARDDARPCRAGRRATRTPG